MRDVSHTHPRTGETFGDSQVFQRGTVVVVDGGAPDSRPAEDGGEAEDDADHEGEPMRDVDHTPREGAPEANEAYARGGEHGEAADADGADPDAAENGDEEPV